MIKHGATFDQSVVEVLDSTTACEKCQKPLNLMASTNGIVECTNCGHPNKVKDMEN